MNNAEVVVVVEFQVDPEEPHSKVWKRLQATVLEQRLRLPPPVLAADNLLELALDGEVRGLRIDRLCWQHAEQTLRVHCVPTEAVATVLREQGVNGWRAGAAKRAATAFLQRCREQGWRLRREPEGGAAAAPPPVQERKEPTL